MKEIIRETVAQKLSERHHGEISEGDIEASVEKVMKYICPIPDRKSVLLRNISRNDLLEIVQMGVVVHFTPDTMLKSENMVLLNQTIIQSKDFKEKQEKIFEKVTSQKDHLFGKVYPNSALGVVNKYEDGLPDIVGWIMDKKKR